MNSQNELLIVPFSSLNMTAAIFYKLLKCLEPEWPSISLRLGPDSYPIIGNENGSMNNIEHVALIDLKIQGLQISHCFWVS